MSRAMLLFVLLGVAFAAPDTDAGAGAAGSPEGYEGAEEQGPTGRLHAWAALQRGQDAKGPGGPNEPEIEMTSITGGAGSEVDLGAAASGPAAPESDTGAVSSSTGGTGAAGEAGMSPPLRKKLLAFGERLIDLFVKDAGTEDRDKFRSSAERMMRNMTIDELATGMSLGEAEAKELATLSSDVFVPVACGLVAAPTPAGVAEPGTKSDPVAEKAAEAEADLMSAEKESADVKFTKQYSAEIRITGYDSDTFKKAQRDMFQGYIAKLTDSQKTDVIIDSYGVVTPAKSLRRRLQAAAGAIKVAFTVKARTAEAANKGAAAINGLDVAAAVAALKEAGLSATTAVEVSKKATVEDTADKLAADSKVENAKEKAKEAQDDAKEDAKAKPAKKGGIAAPAKKSPLKLRPGAGHWVWTLNREKQWKLSGMAEAFWRRQKAKIAAKQASLSPKAEAAPVVPAATGATGGEDIPVVSATTM